MWTHPNNIVVLTVSGAIMQGYRNIMDNCQENAMVLKEGLERTGRFNIVSKDQGVPLVAFSLKDSSRHDEFEISEFLRRFGWIVPAYTMPPDAQHVTVLRVVIREDFSRTFAERLVIDIEKVLHELDALPSRSSGPALQHPNGDTVSEKDLARQREVVSVWKRAVAARKKTQGVC
uniref:Glutamate decarboxylase n=1 Tax=Aegilops tauschii subsp. strangulata TaxID=200361 RepID=A0A453H8V5_AEGTS